jgi:flagellar hook-length control protein FliK
MTPRAVSSVQAEDADDPTTDPVDTGPAQPLIAKPVPQDFLKPFLAQAGETKPPLRPPVSSSPTPVSEGDKPAAQAETSAVKPEIKHDGPDPVPGPGIMPSHTGPAVLSTTADAAAGRGVNVATAAIPSVLPSHASPSAPSAPSMPTQTAPPPPIPLSGLAVAIAANVQDGNRHFDIRLDPPDLGRIDVRLHVDATGHVTSHLIVDRASTLDLLQRDASDLQRSLQQAGLKTSDQGLQFSLRDQSPGMDRNNQHQPTHVARIVVPDSEPAANIVMRSYRRAGHGAGVDIRV